MKVNCKCGRAARAAAFSLFTLQCFRYRIISCCEAARATGAAAMRRLGRLAGHVSVARPAAELQAGAAPEAPAEQDLRRRSAATLAQLGFVPPADLDTRHAAELRDQGWTVVPGVIDQRWLDELRAQYDECIAEEGLLAGMDMAPEDVQARVRDGTDPPPNPGVRLLLDLVNKGPVFDCVWSHPALLDLVSSVLPDFKLNSLNATEPTKGFGGQDAEGNTQPLHRDTLAPPPKDEDYTLVNSVWLLDDFSESNGGTRLRPESHRREGATAEVHIDAPAGSLVVFNGSILHGASFNASGARRRGVFCSWVVRSANQQTDQAKFLRPSTAERLTALGRYLLDVVDTTTA